MNAGQGGAQLAAQDAIADRTHDLIEDLAGSLRILASGDAGEGELHLAISRAIANAVRIELLSTTGECAAYAVERRVAEIFRAGLTLA